MKQLWLLLLPLFCLPDLLFSQETSVGVLKWTDYLIGPYLLSIASAGGFSTKDRRLRPLTVLLFVFGFCALVSTLTISLRYGYRSDYFTRLGLAKLAKFGLYAAAGIGTLRVILTSPELRIRLRWSILASLLTVSISVYTSATVLNDLPGSPREAGFRYEATNAVSVLMSMLLAFLLGEWGERTTHVAWRNAGVVLLPAIVMGFFLTGGRGGWIGLLLALAYVLVNAGLKPSFVLGGFVLIAIGAVVYTQNPSFSHHVDITLNPALLAEETAFARATGFDDGNRVTILINESAKLVRSPIFGSGLFHRGAASGLYPTGSHNFFLQMLLETGLVGGGAIIAYFYRLWRTGRGQVIVGARPQLGSRAAMVAAVAGGLSGEYFYGGPTLLMLHVLIAPALAFGATAATAAPTLPQPISARMRLQRHA